MDADLVKHLLDIKQDIGEVKALCEQNGVHIESVSGKANDIRKELGAHMKDPDAHPQAERRSIGGIGSIVSWVIGTLGGMAGLYALVTR